MTAIVTRLLGDAGATVDLEHTIVVHQIWNNQVRASVSIPPTASVSGLHVPHLPQAAHHVRRPRRVGALTAAAANSSVALRLGKARTRGLRRTGFGQVDVHVGAIAATPPTTNVRIVRKYRELFTDQHTGGDWMAGPAGKDVARPVGGPAQLRPGPGRCPRRR